MRLLALWLLLMCPIALWSQSDSTGTLRGLVLDSRNGEPVPYCLITIEPGDIQCTTNFDGLYFLKNVPAQTCSIVTEASGYYPKTIRDVVIAPNSINNKNITIDIIDTNSVAIPDTPQPIPIPYVKPIGWPVEPALFLNKKRLAIVVGTESVLAVGSLIVLNEIWYKDYPRTTFHTFNDNHEWLGMDKIGHAQTAYTTGRICYDLLRWSSVSTKRSIWIGGLTGFAYQTAIEVLDGYSAEWGFSTGDILANATGSSMFISQQLIWNEQRIIPKFGFRTSGFANYRPEILGSNLAEQIVKDYNGQTYWLSVNISSFLQEDTRVPKWLNLAVGYGATGMTGGHENPPMTNAQGNVITFSRERQYYLSLDIDLTKINTKSHLLRTVFHTIGFLKIPAPGIELSKQGVRPLLFAF